MKKYGWAIGLAGVGIGVFMLWKAGVFGKKKTTERKLGLAGTQIGSRLRTQTT